MYTLTAGLIYFCPQTEVKNYPGSLGIHVWKAVFCFQDQINL